MQNCREFFANAIASYALPSLGGAPAQHCVKVRLRCVVEGCVGRSACGIPCVIHRIDVRPIEAFLGLALQAVHSKKDVRPSHLSSFSSRYDSCHQCHMHVLAMRLLIFCWER